MRDRRYLLSLAASIAAAALTLIVIFLFVALAGLPGAFLILSVPAAFICWFYMGPRPDLAPGKAANEEAPAPEEVGCE